MKINLILPCGTWTVLILDIVICDRDNQKPDDTRGKFLSNVAGIYIYTVYQQLGNVWQCCCQQALRWDTGPTTDLKYPDINLLTILNGKVP